MYQWALLSMLTISCIFLCMKKLVKSKNKLKKSKLISKSTLRVSVPDKTKGKEFMFLLQRQNWMASKIQTNNSKTNRQNMTGNWLMMLTPTYKKLLRILKVWRRFFLQKKADRTQIKTRFGHFMAKNMTSKPEVRPDKTSEIRCFRITAITIQNLNTSISSVPSAKSSSKNLGSRTNTSSKGSPLKHWSQRTSSKKKEKNIRLKTLT